MQRVKVYGPNLSTPSGETFHVHDAECADLRKAPWRNVREDGDQGGYVMVVGSVQEIVEDCYLDQIAESGGSWDEDWYVNDVRIYPCVSLPLEA